VKTNIEAIAIKNLQEILRERGYTAEALFSKFDSDHNGVLSKNEFENALRSITGQTAPQAIVNAIFGALDEDSSGFLELEELLSIVESGPSHSYSAGQSISIEGHPDARFNGIYSQQEGQINSKPSFRNQNGCILYAFLSNSGSSSSWNLDDRDQNGSNDWYRGGWTRAPKDGSVPIGVRRWVGVGKITLSAAGGEDGSSESSESPQDQDSPSGDGELGNLMQEIDAASRYFEEQVSGGEMSVDNAIEAANSAFDRKIEDLPVFMRSPARKAWDGRILEMEKRLRENSPSPSTIAAGVGAVGTVGAIASKTSENLPPPVDSRPEPPAAPEPEPPAAPEPEPPAAPEPEPPAAPEPEPPAAPERVSFSIESAISSFESSRTISERNAAKESLSGSSGSIHIRVNSVERTFGIGLSEEFRGGSTLIAESGEIGELEIRLPSNSDASQFKAGYETEISVTISDWNAVRRRIILEAV
jgi:hypothetical protein